MPHQKIIFVSPREPSGVTWLVNCCLVLGLNCYTHSLSRMWREAGGQFHLQPSAEKFRKWLPVLSDVQAFRFLPGIEIEWMHDFPNVEAALAQKRVLFVRDPRDALLSRYKRDQSPLDFLAYLQAVEPDTGLDKVNTWAAFITAWQAQGPFVLARFEDYKSDAQATLDAILRSLGMACAPADLAYAVQASDFNKAQAAEAAFRAQDKDRRVANRAGKAGEWRQLYAEHAAAFDYIGDVCRPILMQFGYDAAQSLAAHG